MVRKKSSYTFFQKNGLTIVFFILFVISLAGQAIMGFKEHNEFLTEHGQQQLAFSHYLNSGHFLQATFENWESEFLQMALFVLLTIWLKQKGSSESKPMDGDDTDESPKPSAKAPWPVKKGGFALILYQNSLSILLFLFFFVSFLFHWYGSWKDFNLEQTLKNKPIESAVAFLGNPKLWFESFQNWQSEFLSVGAIVLLSVYFRQKGSAQSKPVDMPDDQNE